MSGGETNPQRAAYVGELKMVTKRIRSEYMKKFKDPKWETYTKCYEEMLRYRLTRRLLEHTHNPWFWSGPDSDSDSGGPSPPPPCKNRCETSRERLAEAELEECEGSRSTSVPRLPLPLQDEDNVLSGSHLEAARETGGAEEEREEAPPYSQDRGRDTEGPQQSKAPKPSKPIWGSQRVRPAPTRQPRDGSTERRHPFALYASGEKDADMASRKTHNVGPEASTKEIHESALRAKVRREVGRQIQTQRTERRRAKSAHVDKTRTLVQPEFNPWVTEYMRCFSARSR